MNKKYSDVLVIIPAREGSKGLVDKNIKPFNGVPLVLKTLYQALRLFPKENVFVSTDSEKYKRIIESTTNFLVKELRPQSLSDDTASNDGYISHALRLLSDELNPKWLLILQCTSPLRSDNDIKDIVELRNEDTDLISSVFKTENNPYYLHRTVNQSGYLRPLIKNDFRRRQDCPVVYELNGAMFLLNIKSFIANDHSMFGLDRVKPFIMPHERSIDIDNELDFELAEFMEHIKV